MLFLAIFVVVLVFSLAGYIRKQQVNVKLWILAVFWFIAGALPFYFLPNHMSSYYLTMALFGPALLFAEVFSGKKLVYAAVIVYFFMTVRGLDFLSKTHWIILKNTGPIGSF